MPDAPERLDVPVAGGTLAAYRWPGEGPVVIAAHGITSNHRSWGVVAQALGGDVQLVAPDLRGRGRSNELPGSVRHRRSTPTTWRRCSTTWASRTPWWPATRWAASSRRCSPLRHPGKARSLVLVDGGFPFEIPPGADPDDAIAAVLGPAMARLDMTFDDRGAYRAFWQQHPAFQGIWSNEIDAHVQHDLVGEEPEMRSACSKEAVQANGREFFSDEDVRTAIERVDVPLTFLWAPRGLQDETPGLYREERIRGLENELIPETNHYSILLGEPGARRVASAIRKAAKP